MWGKSGGKGGGYNSGADQLSQFMNDPWVMRMAMGMQNMMGGGGYNSGGSSGGEGKPKTKAGSVPTVAVLNLQNTTGFGTSSLAMEGYPPEGIAIEYWKECEVFSDSHHVLQDFCGDNAMKEVVELIHDPECNMFPEVYEAWKQNGGDDNCPTIAKCQTIGKWAVGFGGKKHAERAAKLALAVTIAAESDPNKVQQVVGYYPNFGQLLQAANIQVGQPATMSAVNPNNRASPY